MPTPLTGDSAWAKRFWLRTLLILTLTAVAYLFLFSRHGLLDILRLKKQHGELQAQILTARIEREDLAHRKAVLSADTTFIAARAHELGLAKPGDLIIRFVPEGTDR